MNTTAGICSSSARYLASRFEVCSPPASFGVTADRGTDVENTFARSSRIASASPSSGRFSPGWSGSKVGRPSVALRIASESNARLVAPATADPYTLPTSRDTRLPPTRDSVHRCLGKLAQRVDRPTIGLHCCRGQKRARRLVHEWHEFVGKAGHRASDADAPHIWTTTDTGHPSAFTHVALHHRPPASQLYDAQWRSVLLSKLTLLILAATI